MADGVGLDLGALTVLLQRCFGADVALIDVRRIRPWSVARCELRGTRSSVTVIVKWLRSNPEQFRVARRQIATEVAGLEFVNAVAPGIAPALLGHDLERDLLVTEDLAPRRTLHSMLSAGLATPDGLVGLHTFAATMAGLHAATAGRDGSGTWDDASRVLITRANASRVLDRLDDLVPVSDRARADAAAAAVGTAG